MINSTALSRLKAQIGIQKLSRGSGAQQMLESFSLPLELGLQLTYRCNLRCEQCFQWGENGQYLASAEDNLAGTDLALDVIERILDETRATRASVYLWGGEPLMYRHWSDLSRVLQQHQRHVVLCTNGIGLAKRMESLCAFSDDLVVLISVDGLQSENDAIRGKNTFSAIRKSITTLLNARAMGEYRGEVAVSCVMTNENAQSLGQFVEYFNELGVDSIYLVFPWRIGSSVALAMDDYFRQTFLPLFPLRLKREGTPSSWHHFTYEIQPQTRAALAGEIRRIRQRKWSARVRFQPSVSEGELDMFLSGESGAAQGRVRCVSKFIRLSVLPNGDVTTCKLFPEFTVGNLHRQTLASAWRGALTREVIARLDRQLTPICGKCVQLYLQGVSNYEQSQ